MPLTDNQQTQKKFWKDFLELVLIVAVVIIPFRIFIAKPFVVDGLSMYPTFDNGDYLIVDELSYRFKDPERGSVVVFQYPKGDCDSFPERVAKFIQRKNDKPCRHLIKRIIGLPGEIVTLTNGKVIITSNEYPDGLTLEEPYVEMEKADNLSYVLGNDQYFVMGDNRDGSSDSRSWGPVPREFIVGRPILSLVPPQFFPGDNSHFTGKTNE